MRNPAGPVEPRGGGSQRTVEDRSDAASLPREPACNVERIIEDDRRWFRRHPGRHFRLRRMASAERPHFAVPHFVAQVIVEQVAPSYPRREAVYIVLGARLANTDEALRHVLALATAPAGGSA